jgi:hypothetical protein
MHRSLAPHKVDADNDHPVKKWKDGKDFSEDVDDAVAFIHCRAATSEKPTRFPGLRLDTTCGYKDNLAGCSYVQYHIVPEPTPAGKL